MFSIFQKFLLIGLIILTSQYCFKHKYIIEKGKSTNQSEKIYLRLFTLFWIIPIYNDIDQDTVCPGKKIRSINFHDSAFSGIVCGFSQLIICPETVSILCTE
jgi:hypothetical protein